MDEVPLRPVRSALALLVTAAGCDRILALGDISVVHDSGRDVGLDGVPAPPPCTSFAIEDDFTSTSACSSWGMTVIDPGGSVTSGGGLLSLEPAMTPLATAGCASTGTFALDSGGVFVQVAVALKGIDVYTGVQSAGAPGYSLGIKNGQLVFADLTLQNTYDYAAYDSATMAWLRLRYDASVGAVAADYSSDGATWWRFATTPGSQPGAGAVGLDASINRVTSFTGPAQLGHFRVCSP
jgi:hypothetical protein